MPEPWLMGLLGGLLIGAAAALFLIGNGRILGASGLLGGLLDGTGRSNIAERLALIAGLIGAPAAYLYLTGAEAATNATTSTAILILAGLAVGYGTRRANGCTSGHGVCGISRFSLRGIVATLIYLFAGAVTMLIARHGLGVI